MGNLRLKDEDTLVESSEKVTAKILELNKDGYAVRTACGHLIVRTDDEWIYLGNINLPERDRLPGAVKLTVKTAAGRKVIARKFGRDEIFARSDESCKSLLGWVDSLGRERRKAIPQLFWDGGSGYWVDLHGERIHFSTNPLEFPS